MEQNDHSKIMVSRQHIDDGVLIIAINRPEVVNCVDGETAYALETAFIEFEEDVEAKVAILTGLGNNFCSGADLAAILGRTQENSKFTPNPMDSNFNTTGPMGVSRLSLSKPVIAAISGYCLAGGLEIACWCDLRVVGEGAQIGVKCRYRGVPLIDGGTIRLPKLIGQSRATELILTGRTISSNEAYEIGFANRLVKASYSLTPVTSIINQVVSGGGNGKATTEEVVKEAVELAKLIASHPQVCMKNDRQSMREAVYSSRVEESLDFDGKNRIENPKFTSSPSSTSSSGGSAPPSPHPHHKGFYNVQGHERRAMQREFELGLQSLNSQEYVEQLQNFLGKASKL